MSEKLDLSKYDRFEPFNLGADKGEHAVAAKSDDLVHQRLLTHEEVLEGFGKDPDALDWQQHLIETSTEAAKVTDKRWHASKAMRQAAADAKYEPKVRGRRDEMPYPIPHKFEATKNAEAQEYPYGAILTINGNGEDKTREQIVTVVGSSGVTADGRQYVRTKEHGNVPAEQIRSLEAEYGIDTSRFVLAGIGPALYWKKVNTIADETEESPGRFKKLLQGFTESHPGLQRVFEDAASRAPIVTGLGTSHPDLIAKVFSNIAQRSRENSGVYSFKEISEKDTQRGRAFYMARPKHPVTIWATARNFDGSVNEERKRELYAQRPIGLAMQAELGPKNWREAILHPGKLYPRSLESLNMTIPNSIGARAVAFANIQRIANDRHMNLTHRQWAISLMNGRSLTQRERVDFKKYMRDPEAYTRRGVSQHPRTIPTPRTA